MGYTYKDAGVDVEAGYAAVRLMRQFIKKTYDQNVIGDVGGFGGMYSLNLGDIKQPVLVAGSDGVGTKLQLAFVMDKHDTVGQDCVAMCVNDVVCQGAKPLFFLDYIATGRLDPEKVALIVKGVAEGCLQAGCALIGGETAEMPGFYKDGEYDIAGFAVGVVDRSKIVDGSDVREGDVIVGLASSGVHSNGYSLVRRLVLQDKYRLEERYDVLGCTVGEELLKPTRIYVKGIVGLLKRFNVKGIAHITGGGFIENIPRILPEGLTARIQLGSWPVLPIFELIKRWGNIEDREMFNTFNMGIGMVLVCSPQEADGVIGQLKEDGYPSYIIGRIASGTGGVVFVR